MSGSNSRGRCQLRLSGLEGRHRCEAQLPGHAVRRQRYPLVWYKQREYFSAAHEPDLWLRGKATDAYGDLAKAIQGVIRGPLELTPEEYEDKADVLWYALLAVQFIAPEEVRRKAEAVMVQAAVVHVALGGIMPQGTRAAVKELHEAAYELIRAIQDDADPMRKKGSAPRREIFLSRHAKESRASRTTPSGP